MALSRAAHGWLPPFLWSLLVAVLLLVPGDEFPDPGRWDWLDKPVHFVLFAVHSGLLWRTLAAAGRRSAAALSATFSGLYAVVLETLQIWVPERGWDAWDLVAGLVGVAVVVLLVAAPARARLRGAK